MLSRYVAIIEELEYNISTRLWIFSDLFARKFVENSENLTVYNYKPLIVLPRSLMVKDILLGICVHRITFNHQKPRNLSPKLSISLKAKLVTIKPYIVFATIFPTYKMNSQHTTTRQMPFGKTTYVSYLMLLEYNSYRPHYYHTISECVPYITHVII